MRDPELLARPLEIPVLETERLLLRGHRVDDLDDVYALWSDPEGVRYTVGQPQTREHSWSRLNRYVGHWALLGYGYWVVTIRKTGRPIGEIGLADFRREIDPPLEDEPEMGWILAGHAHNQGYATEAGRAVLRWRDTTLPGTGTTALIAPANLRSIRLAEKLGFHETRAATYHDEPTLVLRRPQSETRPQQG
jgi:RimJ/RimL family protein N-acetyltransferase